MMDQKEIETALGYLPLGQIEYHVSIGSTNDRALALAAGDAPHFSLVIADEQTSGRGRGGRSWHTPPAAALAFSLVLRPDGTQIAPLSRTAGLGALAVCLAVEELYHLNPQIKWPNDVLLGGRKFCGVLAEAHWLGERLQALVLGIGINILDEAMPPVAQLNFPATSLAAHYVQSIDRLKLLAAVLRHLTDWWPRLAQSEFIGAWESRLAYRGRQVQLMAESQPAIIGELIGLDPTGALCLRDKHDQVTTVQAGEIHLRPFDNRG